MIRRRDRDRVEAWHREQLANVGKRLHVAADLGFRGGEHRAVGIAEADDANPFDLEEIVDVIAVAAALQADDGDTDVTICAGDLRPGTRRERGAGGNERGSLEKTAPADRGE